MPSGDHPSSEPRRSIVESATMTIDSRKWNATTTGLSVIRTAMPPTTAWTSTPTTRPTATSSSGRRRRIRVNTTHTQARASSPTTPVNVRLPNSMSLWIPSSW